MKLRNIRSMRIAAAAVMLSLLFTLLLQGIFAYCDGSRPSAPCFAAAQDQECLLNGLPEVVEKVVPAVVNISSKKIVQTAEGSVSPFFSDPLFRRFFGDEFFRRYNVPRERIQRNLGSGVIVSEDGFIITNNHLVEKAEEVQATLLDGREYDAKIVGTDPRSDVALLKIDEAGLSTIPFGNSTDLRLGQPVLAIGYPFGIGQTVTMGIVSALGRANLRLVDYENFIQTDAAINPGNSGGALINVRGELVGINTAILSRTGGYQGIGFAIPVNLAASVMESIIEHGRVIRGWLGVGIQDMTPQMAEAFELEEPAGVLISDVTKDSPADKGGFEQGDVVVTYGGSKVDNMNEFRLMVSETRPGERIEIEVLRNGGSRKLKVEIGEYPAEETEGEEAAKEGVSPLFYGVALENLTDYYRRQLDLPRDLHGVIVTEIEQGSPGAESGLREADVIVEVNKRRVRSLDDFREILKSSRKDRVLLLVYRDGTHFYLLIRS